MKESWVTFNLSPYEVSFAIEDKRFLDIRMGVRAEMNLGDDQACLYFVDLDKKIAGEESILFSLNVPVDILNSLCKTMEVASKSCKEAES